MIVKIGGRIYETQFSLEDLLLFEGHGEWRNSAGGSTALLADKINNGALYCLNRRHYTSHHHAGSLCALVEVDLKEYP